MYCATVKANHKIIKRSLFVVMEKNTENKKQISLTESLFKLLFSNMFLF